MNELYRKFKETFTIDNFVEFMKDARLIDEEKIKNQDVRETLEKMDPNKHVDVDEVTSNISGTVEQSKSKIEDIKVQSDYDLTIVKESSLNVLQKPPQQPDLTDDEEMAKHENIIAFYN